MNRIVIAGLVCALQCATSAAIAQESWPTRPVHIVVPTPPGGPSDLVARLVGEKLSTLWGQPVVVENRPGGQQMIGASVVAKAPADGYMLLQATSNMATNPIFNKKMPYNTSDLVAVSRTHFTPMLVAVNKDVPARTMPELLQYLRKQGTAVSFGSTGQGSSQQLATFQLIQAAKLPKLAEIPYQGSTQAHPDLIAGRVAMMIDPAAAVAAHVRSGTLRAIAVTTPQRIAALPDVPTLEESGMQGVDLSGWGGLFAPAATPLPVLRKLNADLRKVLASPEVQARFEQLALVAAPSTPEEFQHFVRSEQQRWTKVVIEAGVPLQ